MMATVDGRWPPRRLSSAGLQPADRKRLGVSLSLHQVDIVASDVVVADADVAGAC